jgi:hypothetical protein
MARPLCFEVPLTERFGILSQTAEKCVVEPPAPIILARMAPWGGESRGDRTSPSPLMCTEGCSRQVWFAAAA